MSKSVNDLKFVRLTQPMEVMAIPKALIKQVKYRDMDMGIEQFYQVSHDALMFRPSSTFMYVMLSSKPAAIKGLLWLDYDQHCERLVGRITVVDKAYQGSGTKCILKFMGNLQRTLKVTKPIQFGTSHPKAWIRAGCEQSKISIVEFQGV